MRKFDVHAHCGPWSTIPGAKWDADALLAMYAALGVHGGVVSSVQAILGDLIGGNQETKRVVESHAMLFGYVYIDPHRPNESRKQVEALAPHPKFVGVKSRDDYHGLPYNSRPYLRLFDALSDHRLPALLHTFSLHSMECALEVAVGYRAPMILTHLAGPDWRATERLRDRGIPANIYLDPISSACEPGKYELALSLVGEDRLVFGTDATLFHPALAVGAVESSALPESVKQKLYWDNAARVFVPKG